jgi:hypothetical protein
MPRDTGSNRYFIDGEVVCAVMNGTTNTGTETFWHHGQSVQVILSPAAQGNFFLMFY